MHIAVTVYTTICFEVNWIACWRETRGIFRKKLNMKVQQFSGGNKSLMHKILTTSRMLSQSDCTGPIPFHPPSSDALNNSPSSYKQLLSLTYRAEISLMSQILEMERGMVYGFLSRLLIEKTPKTSCYFSLFSALHFDFIGRSFPAKVFS